MLTKVLLTTVEIGAEKEDKSTRSAPGGQTRGQQTIDWEPVVLTNNQMGVAVFQ